MRVHRRLYDHDKLSAHFNYVNGAPMGYAFNEVRKLFYHTGSAENLSDRG